MPASRSKSTRCLVPFADVPEGHKGWNSRGYLPHFDNPVAVQTLTFRLADSIPQSKLHLLEIEDKIDKRQKIEDVLNRSYGNCELRDPRCASIVEDAFKFFHNERYILNSWVVMPNHIHVIIEPFDGFPLGESIIDSWKGHTVSEINKVLGRSGSFWCQDYFDRYVRDEEHFWNAVRYVHNNPVKAGLCEEGKDWQWSSAFEDRLIVPERYQPMGQHEKLPKNDLENLSDHDATRDRRAP